MPLSTPTQQAAQLLISRRLTGTQGDRLPETCRPRDLDAALAIQAAVSSAWCAQQDDSIGGWKCLLPPEGKLVVGPIYTSTINTVPPVALWAPTGAARIEPELAFVLGRDLPPRATAYSDAEVDNAIARTHMALELIHSRYSDPASASFPEMLADGLVNQGLFIGPAVDSHLAAAASSFAIQVEHGTAVAEHAGAHPNGNPRAPLYWLVEFLRSRGQSLVAGQVFITGSYAGVLEVPLDQPVTIRYAGLGEMTVEFSARAGAEGASAASVL